MIKIESKYNFKESVEKIINLLDGKNIHIFDIIDHKKNAELAGLKMNEEKVIFFGSPASGTPMMLENPEIGLELPSKVLIYELNGNCYVIMPDIKEISKNYKLEKSVKYVENLASLYNIIATMLSS